MRTWVVIINGDWECTVQARTAADAATMAGDDWRAEHTDGADVGGIEDLEVRRVVEGPGGSSGSEGRDEGSRLVPPTS
jgi:hypothetical protein